MTDRIIAESFSPQAAPRRGGLSVGTIVLIAGLLAAVAVIGVALTRQNQSQPTSGPAPDFTVTTFEGETFSLSDLRGQIVVINFWAQWCAPCRQEAPALQATYERYRDQGVVFLGIAWADNGPATQQYLAEYGITYPNAPDMGTVIAERYNIQAVPETFIIDRNGDVAEFFYAPITQAELSARIERVLRGTEAAS